MGRRQAGFLRSLELGKGAPGGLVPVLAAGRWGFERTRLGCRSVASWDRQRARDPPGQWGGGKVPSQGRRVTRSLALCSHWRGRGDAQPPGAGLVCRSSTLGCPTARASGQPASPARRTELSVDPCVGGRRTGATARNPGGTPPRAKSRGNRTLPVRLAEGEAGLPRELWDGGLPALPLGTAAEGHNLQSPPSLCARGSFREPSCPVSHTWSLQEWQERYPNPRGWFVREPHCLSLPT